jgi:hypothetical protein
MPYKLSPKLLTATSIAVLVLGTSLGASALTVFNQDELAAAVQVPAGNRVVMETVGIGSITYECRAKKDAADQFEWVFVGPDAKLMDRMEPQWASISAHPPPGNPWMAPS